MYQVCGNYPAFASFLEEFESLKKFTDVAAQGDDFVIPVDEIELLKTARQMILHRKAVLHESLTLFPVGLFMQQSCNMAMESVCRDKGFDVLVKPDSHDIGPSKSGGACSEAAAHRLPLPCGKCLRRSSRRFVWGMISGHFWSVLSPEIVAGGCRQADRAVDCMQKLCACFAIALPEDPWCPSQADH